MPFLRFLFSLLGLFVPVFASAAVSWQSDPVAAMALARSEGKMLLVSYRPNKTVDRMFADAERDVVFGKALDAFVPLRMERGTTDILGRRLEQLRTAPLVSIHDATGAQLGSIEGGKLRWEYVGEMLLRFRNVRPLAAKAAELRLVAKDDAAADFQLGHALLAAREWKRAAERLDHAATAFEKRGDKASQQLADIAGGHGWAGAGHETRGRKQIEDVLREPVSNEIAAEAHLALGIIDESKKRGIRTRTMVEGSRLSRNNEAMGGNTQEVTLRDTHAARRAVERYRKAYELAPPGSPVLESVRAALARVDDRPLPPKDGVAATLRIIPPVRQTIIGDADFLAQTGPGVARVDFFLDDKQVASANKTPFRATIDVGSTATVRRVKARAFDQAGKAIGDAVVTINDRADAFLVTIVSPVSDVIENAADVELDVRVPPGRTLKNVELSWNGTPFATLTQPPLRAHLRTGGDLGYLRALATLDDGTTSEATKLFNTTAAETVEVGAVTVIASVVDRDGKRIAGLGVSDFEVLEEGKRVDATLRSSDDEPVTIGVAIDSSGSMAGRQLYVIRAAAEFLGRALRPQDEAFVVSFDTSVRLVHPRSRDAASLRNSVLELAPGGGTSIFDGVTFALQQLQGIPGKRALFVLTDGREGTSSASAKECARLARAIGVPVYAIVPPGGEKSGHALLDIVEATGGLLLHATPAKELAAMSDRLAAEVRGQYVLSFTRPGGVKPGEWRSVRVSVRDRDATVRTIQGYRAN
jgi:Ca-activated chloride channel homolog